MKIAVIDDSSLDREELKKILNPYLEKFDFHTNIYEFSSAEEFLTSISENVFDICFMDIYMGKTNGFEAATILSEVQPNCFIIFLTSSPDYIAEGYDIRAWRYIVKPLEKESISKILDPCIEKIVLSNITITIKVERQDVTIPISKIFFVITANRETEIHFKNTKISVSSRTTFSEITDPLFEDFRFISCGKGIAVNLSYVKSIENNCFIMKNGESVPISKRKINDVKTKFLQYCFENL